MDRLKAIVMYRLKAIGCWFKSYFSLEDKPHRFWAGIFIPAILIIETAITALFIYDQQQIAQKARADGFDQARLSKRVDVCLELLGGLRSYSSQVQKMIQINEPAVSGSDAIADEKINQNGIAVSKNDEKTILDEADKLDTKRAAMLAAADKLSMLADIDMLKKLDQLRSETDDLAKALGLQYNNFSYFVFDEGGQKSTLTVRFQSTRSSDFNIPPDSAATRNDVFASSAWIALKMHQTVATQISDGCRHYAFATSGDPL